MYQDTTAMSIAEFARRRDTASGERLRPPLTRSQVAGAATGC